MKKKDIIASIKQSALNEIPDVLYKIDISKIEIESVTPIENQNLIFIKLFHTHSLLCLF